MKRIIFVLGVLGILASLFGCGRKAPPPPTSTIPKEISAIDYAHESDGVFYHGTVTLIDGQVGATWTTDDGKSKKSKDIPMTPSTFKTIWDALGTIPDFKTGAVTNANQQLDPSAGYIVGVVSSAGDKPKIESFMIPTATASPAFREWLSKSGYGGKQAGER